MSAHWSRVCRDLAAAALTSTIPTELGQLTELRHVFLSNNSLTSSIPTELGMLPALSVL
jgi:hypothetical protein